MVLFIFSAPDWLYKTSISSYKPLISNISWFSDISNVTFLWLFLVTPYLSTWNIDLPPWDLFFNSNEENNIIIWHFVRDKCQVPNSRPAWIWIHYQQSWFFIFWFICDDFHRDVTYFSCKHEKSKTRNFLGFILPPDFFEKLGYEFHFDQKTWNDILSISPIWAR